MITWVGHSCCFRSFSLACSGWRRVGSDFFLVTLQVTSSGTLDCSAGGSANVLKFVKILALSFGLLSCFFSHTSRLFGFRHGHLGPCALKNQTIYSIAEEVSKFSQLGKVSFPLT